MRKKKTLICDVDGVLWIGGSPAEGAIEFVNYLQSEDYPFTLLTNSCHVSKLKRLKGLIQGGFKLFPSQLITASEVTVEWLKVQELFNVMYLGAPDTLQDFEESFNIRERGPVDAVVIGDLFDNYDRLSLDEAAKAVENGAELIAMQKNTQWCDGKEWFVDNGFWVAGLEYVTGQQAITLGKPFSPAYTLALKRIGVQIENAQNTFFVSDDVRQDLKGAKELKLTTVYFGPPIESPPWVDYSVQNYDSLHCLLSDWKVPQILHTSSKRF